MTFMKGSSLFRTIIAFFFSTEQFVCKKTSPALASLWMEGTTTEKVLRPLPVRQDFQSLRLRKEKIIRAHLDQCVTWYHETEFSTKTVRLV